MRLQASYSRVCLAPTLAHHGWWPAFCNGVSVQTTSTDTVTHNQSAMSAPTNASTCISWRWKQLTATMVRQLHASPSKFCVAQMCAFSPPPFISHVEVMISCLGSSEILFMPLVLALLRANLTDIIFCGCPARHRSNSALMFVMRMTSQLNFPQPPSVYEDSETAWLPGHMVTQIIGRHCRHKQFSGNTSDLYPFVYSKVHHHALQNYCGSVYTCLQERQSMRELPCVTAGSCRKTRAKAPLFWRLSHSQPCVGVAVRAQLIISPFIYGFPTQREMALATS